MTFAEQYYRSATPIMMDREAGELFGGMLPALAIAAITGNPELAPAEVAGADIAGVASEANDIAETLEAIKQTKTIEQAQVDRLHVVSDVVEEAKSFQGSRDYPGVDDFQYTVLKKGDIIFAGEPGVTGFFTSLEDAQTANGDAKALFEGLQVAPRNNTYRPGLTAFQVTEDVAAAIGRALANPQYGGGGFTQYYLPNYEAVTEPIVSQLLDNTKVE